MSRADRFVCCVSLLGFLTPPLSAQQFRAPESTPVTVTATVEAVDSAKNSKALQALKVGDTVDVTYFESLLINVARPKK